MPQQRIPSSSAGSAPPGRALSASPAAARRSPSSGAVARRSSSFRGGSSGGSGSILKWNTDDAPGIHIGPTVVLVFSLLYIACVVLLHVWGKFRS